MHRPHPARLRALRRPALIAALAVAVLGSAGASSATAATSTAAQALIGLTALTPADDGASQAEFGSGVSVEQDGHLAVAGGPTDGKAGSVWVFSNTGNYWVQAGSRLNANDATPGARFGAAVAISSDGRTAVVGGPADSDGAGAAWIFTRSSAGWTQRGRKLTPSDAAGATAGFGSSIAVSADGSVVVVGGPGDADGTGAAWVFRLSGNDWGQQGAKLTRGAGTGFAASVAVSGDGNTAVVGGGGSVSAFTRAGATYTASGNLTPTAADASFGASVALDADGEVALVGAPDGQKAWGFARGAQGWFRQADPLSGAGASSDQRFGTSVALSDNGNLALVGGPSATTGAGGAWAYTRDGSKWTAKAAELQPGDGGSSFGTSIALSGNGSTATIGAPHDNGDIGLAWTLPMKTVRDTPRCFGAAARDPEQACHNSRLATMVTPTPTQAQLTPSAACTLVPGGGKLRPCTFGLPAANATATIALLGDSHAIHWRAAMDAVARTKRWAGVSIVQSGCPYTADPQTIAAEYRKACSNRDQLVPDWFQRNPDVHTVFVAAHAAGEGKARSRVSFEARVRGYMAAWQALPASVQNIIVIRDNPEIPYNTFTCVDRARGKHAAGPGCAIPRKVALGPDPAAVAAQRMGGRVKLLDLTNFFCDSRQCFPVVGGVLVYRDPNHVTSVFAATLAPYFVREIDQLLQS
jgi:hypothetical protein